MAVYTFDSRRIHRSRRPRALFVQSWSTSENKDMENLLDQLPAILSDNQELIGLILSFIAGSGLFSFTRRAKEASQGDPQYFTEEGLLTPPMERPAYSDRMAYVLAEMSALAYWEFEARGAQIDGAADKLLELLPGDADAARKWFQEFAEELLVKGADSEAFLRKVLEKSGFELLGTIDVQNTQGFVARRVADGEPPYVVVAFRGTEKRIDDWLTDADAVPYRIESGSEDDGEAKLVHKGFREALLVKRDKGGKTALDRLLEILELPAAKTEDGHSHPLFITGHSLGGALALLTTVEAARDINGACYTFGSPRVANYEYFYGVKTPVFRVVNSADIVPRVPPGAILSVILKLMQALSWASSLAPPVKKIVDWLEMKLDKLNGYRHFGDLRYLTDIKAGRFDQVRLLSNPPAIDRIMWMGQQLGVSISQLFVPVKSHGMKIYRMKLAGIAERRRSV